MPVGLLILVGFSCGQPGNFSGSPGDNGTTCTQCHSVGANHSGIPSLTNVPTDYTAGQTYTLNLAIDGSTVSKFGFNITAEDVNGDKIGSWSAGAGTRLRSDGNGLTHNSSGTSSNSWNVAWTAPSSDMGPVTFYYATNQANGNNSTSGDQVITGQSGAVLTNRDNLISSFKLFPTHAVNNINIELAQSDDAQLMIYNMNGQPVMQRSISRQNLIDITPLSSGIYITQVIVDNKISTHKFIKN
ncbi:choice-of-anchor V domain-containing protein [uncultured Nonlabens sp.]|uniref:choice-of-anchor V domain-containing protein n=1 Tax=uncultured Nonlabens sp. TaxID=859306 RepID=UPI0034577DFA